MRTRPRRSPLALAAAALAVILAGACRPAAPHQLATPQPSPRGTSLGQTASAVIGFAGGSLSSPDGKLAVTVGPGAVRTDVTFTIDEITNTAPGGVGNAYRIGPAGVVLAQPAVLRFRVDPTAAVDQLAAAMQDGGTGYWLRLAAATRDLATNTISAEGMHLGDWTVVPRAADLSGTFHLDSTLGIPFSADGNATLDLGTSDDQMTYYVLFGTITAHPPILIGTSSCAPAQPTVDLATSIADASWSAARFDFGLSARWDLTCSDGSTASLSSLFDTYGTHFAGCARAYGGAPVVTPERLQGSYTVDCGPQGKMTASWDLQRCAEGVACATNPNPCKAGQVDCSTGAATCVDTATAVADGTSCGAGLVCRAGVCGP